MSRWNFKSLFTANDGGVCGCGLKPSDVFEPGPKSKSKSKSKTSSSGYSASSSTSSSWDRYIGGHPIIDDDGYTSTTFSHNIDDSPEIQQPSTRIHDSLAVVKDSDDPYTDFRQSMLQMIVAKEIYSRSDLRQLLRCFLELNSPRHHKVIVRAFVDIWNGGEEETPLQCSST